MFPQFEFLGKTFGMYGICAITGFIVCGFVIAATTKKINMPPEDIILALISAAIGVMIGGSLLYGIVNMPNMVSSLRSADAVTAKVFFKVLVTTFGGSVFYGGFFGSLLAVYIYGAIMKSTPLYLDILAFSTPLFHAFGRIGCFFAGCCYGIESRIGFTAHGNPLIDSVNGVSRFPVQLLESGMNLLLFSALIILFRKNKLHGRLIFIYMISYSVIRFCTEFLRGDEHRGIFLWFSTSQWISLIIFPISLTALIMSLRKDKSVMQ